MLLLTYLQNVDGSSLNATETTLSNMHRTLYTILHLTSFKSDLPLSSLFNLFNRSDLIFSDSKKTDEKPVDEFL